MYGLERPDRDHTRPASRAGTPSVTASLAEPPQGKAALSKRDASRIWRAKPDTRKVVVTMIETGWVVWQGSKHYHARCPHGYPSTGTVSINSTPQNDSSHARRLRDQAAKCPRKHDYIR